MSEWMKPFGRTPQVIRALYEYGPLNAKAFTKILEPNMESRRVRDCLHRLSKRGLVIKCNKLRHTFSENYYQLSNSQLSRPHIANILNRNPETLNIPNFRAHDVEHSTSCAYWSHFFSTIFPQAEVIRDFHISSNPRLLNRLQIDDDLEMYPDIVVFLKSDVLDDYITIAIEVERTHKSRGRIFHKLNKFSTRSHIDGVIYLCPTHALIDLVDGVYTKRLSKSARRIRKYGEYFLLLTNKTHPPTNHNVRMFSSLGNTINLKTWITKLMTIKCQKRRDEMFKLQPPSAEA